jgi:hypothetical protein
MDEVCGKEACPIATMMSDEIIVPENNNAGP